VALRFSMPAAYLATYSHDFFSIISIFKNFVCDAGGQIQGLVPRVSHH
jgi:hypothetical protein